MATETFFDSTLVVRTVDAPAVDDRRLEREAVGAARSLERWLGTPFTVFDGNSARLLLQAKEHPPIDWEPRAALICQVAQQCQPSLLEEEDPLFVLAIPLADARGDSLVAVGLFLSRAVTTVAEVSRAAALFNVEAEALLNWATGQKVRDAETVEQMAALAAAKMSADLRVQQLEDEVDKLSFQMSATFEEISLIYRVTQHLKISSNREDLAQLVLGWLREALPVSGMALQFIAHGKDNPVTGERAEPLLLANGDCPLDNAAFSRLVESFGDHATSRPVIFNRPATEDANWPFPGVHEMMLVPLAEGKRQFGWLAAFNHRQGLEFGTVEGSLLSSIGSILGIHCSNIDLYRQRADMLAEVVRAMSLAIDAKDPYTRGHSDRVARVSVRLAQELGCNDDTVKTIYLSGLLHDIGKIGIDDNVLRKPGKLTEAEFEHVKTHAEIGYRILRDLRNMGPVLPVVLHHHESWDGSGYPYGLSGTNIPFLARIVAVADAYDAMSSDRPYRPGMPDEKLDAIMRAGAGKQWDADVVAAFFRNREAIRDVSRREIKHGDDAWLEFS